MQATGFHTYKRECPAESFPGKFSSYVASFGDVYYWPPGNFTVVTRAVDAVSALTDPALSCDRSSFFMSRMPNLDLSLIKDFFSVVRHMMVMSDSADHKRRRSIAARGLTDELLASYGARIPGHIEDLVRSSCRHGSIDFATDVAAKLPCIILADLFGIPEEDREHFYLRSNQMTAFFGGGTGYENADGIRVNAAAVGLREYFTGLLAARRERPQADFFSRMVQSADRLGLADDEIIAQGIMMLVAGQVTTSDQMCNIMHLFLQHDDLQETVRANPALVPAMVEELMRLDPAVTFIFRVAKAHTMIGTRSISPGDVIFISTHAINRDPLAFPDPDRIDLQREARHFSFGFGAHHCIGAGLARMEIYAVFSWLLQRYRLKPAGEAVRDHYSLSFSGFGTLPLGLEALHDMQ
jgi:cytochrome P450